MQKLHFSILINAPKEKIWTTALEDQTYREWTGVFNPAGSYFEGSWSTGSDIRFLGPEKDGTVSGMISRIKEARPFDFISIEHLGEIKHGQETKYGEGTKKEEMFENYTFNNKDGGTELLVDLTTSGEFPGGFEEMFNDLWPKALEKLKSLAEKSVV